MMPVLPRPAALPQAPWLRDLQVELCPLNMFQGLPPPAVVGCASLQELVLAECSLTRLPPGPYMRGEGGGRLVCGPRVPIHGWPAGTGG